MVSIGILIAAFGLVPPVELEPLELRHAVLPWLVAELDVEVADADAVNAAPGRVLEPTLGATVGIAAVHPSGWFAKIAAVDERPADGAGFLAEASTALELCAGWRGPVELAVATDPRTRVFEVTATFEL